jgi:hypothetical protein
MRYRQIGIYRSPRSYIKSGKKEAIAYTKNEIDYEQLLTQGRKVL